MFFTSKEEKIILQFLSSSPFFSDVSSRSLKSLVKAFIPTPIRSGDYLMKPGGGDQSLYLVMHGRLRVFENVGDSTKELGEIGHGEFIGEVALLTDGSRDLGVYAIRDSLLLKLSKDDFYYFTKRHHNQMINIVKHAILRIKENVYVKNRLHTFCLMPAGTSQQIRAFSNAFINTLEGKTLYLTKHNIKALLRRDNIDYDTAESTDISRWLHEQENHYRFIIYESGHEVDRWSRLCVRQADKAILIANYDADCALNPLEQYLFEKAHCSKELVILQKSSLILPEPSQKWLKKRPIQSHHHVSLERKETIARMVRYLSNRNVALVLGGGGARGLAHIGVYKALLENHIPIDCVAGTSSGSAVAALIAMDLAPDELIAVVRREVVKNRFLIRRTLPIYSVISGRPVARTLKRLYGEHTRGEDLWRRFFCIATSLSALSSKPLTEGLLWKNIRASCSIPGILPPISTKEEELLIDGAITNNLPVDIMESFSNRGFVISVNVSGDPKMSSNAIPNGYISAFSALKEKFFYKRLPTISEMSLEAMLLCSHQHQQEMIQRSQLHIECNPTEYGLLNFKAFDALIEKGYQSACEALDKSLLKFS